jgi:ribonuclease D
MNHRISKDSRLFINDQNELAAFAKRAQESPVLAIDTEFLREKTYYPRLCLLQMATDKETVIVDPFEATDMSVLRDVLEDAHVMKLFHAGSQDIEILHREVGVIPHPLFDTQIAASLLGHTQQIGYGSLVGSICNVQLKKGDSFTDWSRRPLSESQIDYAADDVIYLPRMYATMRAQLESMGRLGWLDADFADLGDLAKYEPDEMSRYRRLKRVSQLDRRQLSAARELAAWRERRAQKRDIPRKWVMTDEQLVEACKRDARSIDELFMVRGLSDKLSMKDAREVVAALIKGYDLPKEQWPTGERGSRNEVNVDVEVDVMSALVRLRARQNDIAFQTLAGHGDLASMARGRVDVEVMQGWRREIVGNELVDLMEGRIALSLQGGNLQVTRIDQK